MPGFTIYNLMIEKKDEGVLLSINYADEWKNEEILWRHFDWRFLHKIFSVITKDCYTEGNLVFLPVAEIRRRCDELNKKLSFLTALGNAFIFIGEICNLTPQYIEWK